MHYVIGNGNPNMILTSNEYYLDSTTYKRKIKNPISIKPNIILIVLESFLGSYCGFINQDKRAVTPNLNKIAEKGYLSSKFCERIIS